MVIVFNRYFKITKPGIVMSNLLSTSGGFLLASRGNINFKLFFIILLSTSLVIASACIVNNIIDRDVDMKMIRTKNRDIVTGKVSIEKAALFSVVMGVIGISLIFIFINFLTFLLSIIGYFIYVVIYTLIFKRRSIYSVLIGSISGAMPPIIGYSTVTNTFDVCSIVLLLMFCIWQLPHFFAISIIYLDDYEIINIPTFASKKGVILTQNYILYCIFLFLLVSLVLYILGYVGTVYLVLMALLNFFWFLIALKSYFNSYIFAKYVFYFSIVVIIIFDFLISLDYK